MPKAKTMTPEAAKARVLKYAAREMPHLITPEDLNLAEEVDPNIRTKMENKMSKGQGSKLEPQSNPTKSNPQFPFQSPNNSPASPNPVKSDGQVFGSNPVGEEKERLNKKQKEYHDFVAKRLGPFVVIILYFFVFRGDEEKSEFYAPNKEECKELAPHIARIAPKIEEWLHVPQHVHDIIVTSDDTFSLLLVVVGYLKRTGILGSMIPGFAGRMYRKVEEPNGVDIRSQGNGNGASPNGHTTESVSPEQWALYGIGAQYQ